MPVELTVRELSEIQQKGTAFEKDQLTDVCLQGWIRQIHDRSGLFWFELHDGTCFQSASVRFARAEQDAGILQPGMAVTVIGTYQEEKGSFWIQADQVIVEADCAGDSPQAAAFLAGRSDDGTAYARLQSAVHMGLHEFFQNQGFLFRELPSAHHAECLAAAGLSFRDVYSVRPYAAEQGETWLAEAEMAFADLEDAMDLMEDLLRYLLESLLLNCPQEMAYEDQVHPGRLARLQAWLNAEYPRLDFTARADPEVPSFVRAEQRDGGLPLREQEGRPQAVRLVLPDGTVLMEGYQLETDGQRLQEQNETLLAQISRYGACEHAGMRCSLAALMHLLAG